MLPCASVAHRSRLKSQCSSSVPPTASSEADLRKYRLQQPRSPVCRHACSGPPEDTNFQIGTRATLCAASPRSQEGRSVRVRTVSACPVSCLCAHYCIVRVDFIELACAFPPQHTTMTKRQHESDNESASEDVSEYSGDENSDGEQQPAKVAKRASADAQSRVRLPQRDGHAFLVPRTADDLHLSRLLTRRAARAALLITPARRFQIVPRQVARSTSHHARRPAARATGGRERVAEAQEQEPDDRPRGRPKEQRHARLGPRVPQPAGGTSAGQEHRGRHGQGALRADGVQAVAEAGRQGLHHTGAPRHPPHPAFAPDVHGPALPPFAHVRTPLKSAESL